MKKGLLFLYAALMGLNASAAQNTISRMDLNLSARSIKDGAISRHQLMPEAAARLEALRANGLRRAGSIANPTTQPRDYSLSGYFFTYAGMAYGSGLAQQVAFEGDKVYLSNLFPIMLETRKAWTVGELNEAGDLITVPVQHVYDEDWYAEGYDVEFYMGDVQFDEEGNITDIVPFVFNVEDDFIYIDDLNEVDEEGYAKVNHRIGLFAYNAEGTIDLYDYVAGHELTPYEVGEKAECPADARVEEYVYRALDDYGDPVTYQYQVAFSGDKVYFNGLTPDCSDWVCGTLDDDNIVSIPSGQYVGVKQYYYTYFSALRVAGHDPNGDANFNIEPTLQLQYDPETGAFTMADPEVFIGELIYMGKPGAYAVLAAFGENQITPMGTAVAAVPTAPYNLFVMDLEDYGFEQWDFGFTLDNKGTNDEYLMPSNLKVYLFFDEELFTFEPGEYDIPEPICGIAYDDIDSNDAFYHNDNLFDLYINKGLLYNRLGVVAVYSAEGVSNYSDIVYFNPETEEVSVEQLTASQIEQLGIDQTVAIEQVNGQHAANAIRYDLMGRRLEGKRGLSVGQHGIAFSK